MTTYAIIGAGWRAEFYLRIATLCPQQFAVSGICIRNAEKRAEFVAKYTVPIFETVEELLNTAFDFVVSCVNRDNIMDMADTLSKKGIFVLTETPVMQNIPNEHVQVAEQFHLMPRNQAYKAIIDSGLLGDIQQVQLSCCHDYHAASLIRFFLGTNQIRPRVTTVSLQDCVYRYNSRAGIQPPTAVDSEEKICILDFGDKSAVYDFSFEQYFSDIRATRIVIRGTNGEIQNNVCTYLQNGLPHSFEIKRNSYGAEESLDGMSLCNITGNGKVLYINPFSYARLSDEEIAIATVLQKMSAYAHGGAAFYPPCEAAFDYALMQ